MKQNLEYGSLQGDKCFWYKTDLFSRLQKRGAWKKLITFSVLCSKTEIIETTTGFHSSTWNTTPQKQLEFYLVVTNNSDEICLGWNNDKEFCFIGSLPLVLSTDNEGQGIVITNIDLLLITTRKQGQNELCIQVLKCFEVAELRETRDILRFHKGIGEIWRQYLCFRSVRYF